MIQTQYKLIARINSIIQSPEDEVTHKKKVLLIKILLLSFKQEMEAIEEKLLSEEASHYEALVPDSEQKITALSMRFTIYLN